MYYSLYYLHHPYLLLLTLTLKTLFSLPQDICNKGRAKRYRQMEWKIKRYILFSLLPSSSSSSPIHPDPYLPIVPSLGNLYQWDGKEIERDRVENKKVCIILIFTLIIIILSYTPWPWLPYCPFLRTFVLKGWQIDRER